MVPTAVQGPVEALGVLPSQAIAAYIWTIVPHATIDSIQGIIGTRRDRIIGLSSLLCRIERNYINWNLKDFEDLVLSECAFHAQ
jgi:hypothetical protein